MKFPVIVETKSRWRYTSIAHLVSSCAVGFRTEIKHGKLDESKEKCVNLNGILVRRKKAHRS